MKCWTGEAGWVSVSTVIFYHPYPSWDEAQAMTRHPLWLDRNPNGESLVWSGEGLKEVEMARAFATAVVICLLSNWSLCLVCANRNCVICYQSATCESKVWREAKEEKVAKELEEELKFKEDRKTRRNGIWTKRCEESGRWWSGSTYV